MDNQVGNNKRGESMKEREGYTGGLCDPTKATNCSKTRCSYITKDCNDCRHTTNPMWLKENNYDKSK